MAPSPVAFRSAGFGFVSLLGVICWLQGCFPRIPADTGTRPQADADTDADADGDADGDTDADTDTDTRNDSALWPTVLEYKSSWSVSGSNWTTGTWAYALVSAASHDEACQLEGELYKTSASSIYCPSCSWQFTLSVRSSRVSGHCGTTTSMSDGLIDGPIGELAFAPSYQFYSTTYTNLLFWRPEGAYYIYTFAWATPDVDYAGVTGNAANGEAYIRFDGSYFYYYY